MGNLHVKPLARLWNTDSPLFSHTPETGGRKLLRNRKKTMPKIEDVRKNYLEMIYLYQIESKETVEDMVKK